jgi:hypothetical protein
LLVGGNHSPDHSEKMRSRPRLQSPPTRGYRIYYTRRSDEGRKGGRKIERKIQREGRRE